MWCIVFTLARLLAAESAAADASALRLPTAVPPVLLCAPVNATWAANNAAYWKGKGFRGFLLSGIADGLDTDVWALDGDPATTSRDDLAVREVLLANRRLIEAGIDRNFLVIPLEPERAYFADAQLRDDAAAQVVRAAEFCRVAELRGLAFDTRSTSLQYQYTWDGYDHETALPEALEQGARDFGGRLVAGVVQACPEAEFLVLADAPLESGPLWLPFFDGIVEALDGVGKANPADGARIHLLTRETLLECAPARIRDLLDRTRRMLDLHLSPKAARIWRAQGSLCAGVRPLACRRENEGAGPFHAAPEYPIEAFRVQLVAAKLLSSGYVWVEGNGPSWWRLSEEDAATYGGLFQNGKVLWSQTVPTAPNLESYTVTTPIDAFERVGPIETRGTFSYVLRGDHGAVLAMLEGGRDRIVVDGRVSPGQVTDLQTGEERGISPEAGRIAMGPFTKPSVVNGLPIRQWVIPAGLWIEPRADAAPSGSRMPIRYGLVNRTGLALSGTLAALVPARFSVKPASVPVALDPGEAVRVDGILAGRASPREQVSARLEVACAGGRVAQREFLLSVPPAERWAAKLRGAVTAPAVTFKFGGTRTGDRYGVVVCTQAGELACLDSNGALSWRYQFPARFDAPAAVGCEWSGQTLIVVVDHLGNLRAFRSNGEPRFETSLDGRPAASGALFANLHRFPGDEIVVGLEDGRIVASLSNGQSLWSVDSGLLRPFLTTADLNNDGRDEVLVAGVRGARENSPAKAATLCLDSAGERLWEADSPDAPSCAPVVADLDSDGGMDIAVGHSDGSLQILRGADGSEKQTKPHAAAHEMGGLLAADLLPAPGLELLVSDGAALSCFSNAIESLWSAPLPCAATPAIVPGEDAIKGSATPEILAPCLDGTLVCLSADGRRLWADTRSAGPLTARPVVADLDADGRPDCIYASTDRFVRSLRIP